MLDLGMHDWQNCAVIGINKRKAHVPLWSYRSTADALQRLQTGRDGDRSGRTYLSAPDWQFRLYGKPDDVPADFPTPQLDAESWAQVPTHPRPITLYLPCAAQHRTQLASCLPNIDGVPPDRHR